MPRKADNIAEVFTEARNDYDAAKNSRFVRRRRGLAPGGGPADYHIKSESEYYTLIEKARDMDRNDALVGQSIDRLVSNVVQDGFTLIPNTGDKNIDLILWELWHEWIMDPEMCDIAGEMSFHDFETSSLRSSILDGDCLVSGLEDGRLQFFESHQIGSATRMDNTLLGVTIDENRRRQKYWIAKDIVGANPRNKRETATPLDVRDSEGVRQLFHLYDPKRATLTRGVTSLAPIMVISGILEDSNFAKLVQQQMVSCVAILRENVIGSQSKVPNVGATGETTTEQSASGESRRIEGWQPGMDIEGRPGQTLKGFSPDIPNNEWFQHFRQQVAMIGANLDLSPAQVLLDFSLENFVGYRGALHEARKGMRRRQKVLVKRFHRPVYVWRISKFIEENESLARDIRNAGIADPTKHNWSAPSFEYLEPVNDAAADLLRVRNALTSRRRLHAERSQDWETIADELIDDNAYVIEAAIRKAEEINKRHPNNPQPVSWMQVANLPTADGVNVNLSPGRQDQPATASQQPSKDQP